MSEGLVLQTVLDILGYRVFVSRARAERDARAFTVAQSQVIKVNVGCL